jgi:hypothetical protein
MVDIDASANENSTLVVKQVLKKKTVNMVAIVVAVSAWLK